MLWIEAMNFYSAALGGGLCAIVVVLAFSRSHRDTLKLLEAYWNSDIREIKRRLNEFETKANKLSPNSGENSVQNR